ncbi:L,D-transpeptidase family protein [Solitalea koreensis]|uniref:L,D-transpeptidase family protein n=1 Tax=Solitalea koreensis TaxID=543615 RepID=UPI00163D68E5|nr:L,D-transpeptidase family protein [Solitalea koreensis]
MSPAQSPSKPLIFSDSTHANQTLYIDSNWIQKEVAQNDFLRFFSDSIVNFYKNRNFKHAWFDSTELTESAKSFINALHSYTTLNSGNKMVIFPELKIIYSHLETFPDNDPLPDTLKRQMDLLLTGNFYYFINFIHHGDNERMKDINWFIPLHKISTDSAITHLLKNAPNSKFDSITLNNQFDLLLNSLRKYYAIEKKNNWDSIELKTTVLKVGSKNGSVPEIKTRLYLFGDLTTNDRSTLFTKELKEAVVEFQKSNGLKEDGVIGPQVLSQLNRPIHDRVLQILVNLERSKWMQAKPNTTFIIVNIPEFKMHVYEGSTLSWSCSVIVGKAGTNTISFTSNMKYIVFSPYWNIPQSIIKSEIIPEMIKKPSYIAHHNMEIRSGEKVMNPASITWSKYQESRFPYSIRQKPGAKNALGYVKFIFPNEYNIYLHDTPEKGLFNQTNRMFSHGCIRIEEPLKLAQFLLKADTSWTDEKIKETMYNGEEKVVILKKMVPVFINYLTAWVDENNRLNFRADIYGHDAKLAKQLFLQSDEDTSK